MKRNKEQNIKDIVIKHKRFGGKRNALELVRELQLVYQEDPTFRDVVRAAKVVKKVRRELELEHQLGRTCYFDYEAPCKHEEDNCDGCGEASQKEEIMEDSEARYVVEIEGKSYKVDRTLGGDPTIWEVCFGGNLRHINSDGPAVRPNTALEVIPPGCVLILARPIGD